MDLDVPRNGSRVQLVHYFSSNVTMNPSTSLLTLPAGEVPYLQPSPPVGDSPHAYTFILFSQPAGFSVPSQYANLSNNRVPFNVAQFASDTKLTQALAANYIRVQNLTGSATQSFPAPRPTGSQSASGPAVFPGGASQMVSVNGITFWAGLSTAMLVGFAAIAL